MGENTNKFNLEIGLFLKEIKSFIQQGHGIDNETIKLLTETIFAINQLQCTAQFHENDADSENIFFFELENDHFQFRRHIVCRLCLDHIPMSRDDFEAHVQKTSHKKKDRERTVNVGPSVRNEEIETAVVVPNNASEKPTTSEDPIDRSIKNVTLPTMPLNDLKNLIDDKNIFKQIAIEAKRLECRNNNRVYNEARILEILRFYLQNFDSKLNLLTFGSSTYGFGGDKTNFNILIDIQNSDRNAELMLHEFGKYIGTTDMTKHFKDISPIYADRTMKKQLKMVHIESGIAFLLLVDSIDITNASKIINDYCDIRPICRNLITYIRAWQNIINRNAFQKYGSIAFEFNTYIISALVIFYLQLHQKLKTIDDIQTIVTTAQVHDVARSDLPNDMARFLDYLYEFFYMYGERYQNWNHVMSCHIGRWQERRIQPEQRVFTPNQKRLRDGIKQSETNWKNCYMYLQDFVRPNLNMTAEIPKEHAENFQELCRLFAIQLRKNQS